MSEPEPISTKQFRDYPELREWLGHDYGSMWDYLNFRGNYELAAVFAKLFWPDFVEVDGSVYLADKFHANGDYRWEDTGWTRTQIESVVNHCHLYDMFWGAKQSQVDLAVLELTAQTLKQTWTCALAKRFPNRKFVVVYATEPDEYGPTVTFWQDSETSA